MLTKQLTNDAAALHQAILRHGGEVSPFFCGKELGWEHRRIARAMEELVATGIIDPAAAVLPKPLKQRKTYDFPEIQAILADFPAFARAVHAVEHAVGRRLPTADLSALTELFDFHGLSPEALELLTAQCCGVYDPSGHQLLHGPGDAAVLPAQLFSAEERGDLAAVVQDSLMQRCRVGGQLFGKHGAPLLPCWFSV